MRQSIFANKKFVMTTAVRARLHTIDGPVFTMRYSIFVSDDHRFARSSEFLILNKNRVTHRKNM